MAAMLGSAGSAGSAGVESSDDANETSALIRSNGLLREPGDAVASGDVASDAAGDVATSARVTLTESGAPGAAKAPLWREPLWAGAARALPAWFLI